LSRGAWAGIGAGAAAVAALSLGLGLGLGLSATAPHTAVTPPSLPTPMPSTSGGLPMLGSAATFDTRGH
jgi:hypothetical protein